MHDKGRTGEGSTNILLSKIVDQTEHSGIHANQNSLRKIEYILCIYGWVYCIHITSILCHQIHFFKSLLLLIHKRNIQTIKIDYVRKVNIPENFKRAMELFSILSFSSSFKPIELTNNEDFRNAKYGKNKKFLRSMLIRFFPIPLSYQTTFYFSKENK